MCEVFRKELSGVQAPHKRNAVHHSLMCIFISKNCVSYECTGCYLLRARPPGLIHSRRRDALA